MQRERTLEELRKESMCKSHEKKCQDKLINLLADHELVLQVCSTCFVQCIYTTAYPSSLNLCKGRFGRIYCMVCIL